MLARECVRASLVICNDGGILGKSDSSFVAVYSHSYPASIGTEEYAYILSFECAAIQDSSIVLILSDPETFDNQGASTISTLPAILGLNYLGFFNSPKPLVL